MSLQDRVTRYLQPLESVLADPDVTEVMINEGGRKVFIEKHGQVTWLDITIEPRMLEAAIKNIAAEFQLPWSDQDPILDARLDDGSRISAVGQPNAVDGPYLTIRRFGQRYTLHQLVALDMLPVDVAVDLTLSLLDDKRTIIITGGTGTGKTTLLNALAGTISDHDRIGLLEDTAEIYLDCPNVFRLTTSTDPPVTMSDLLRVSLRHRPDRIIVGEVRGPEAFALLQALNTGHQGSLTTLHANSALAGLHRFASLVQMAGVSIPYETVCSQIAATESVIVHIRRLGFNRVVSEVARVVGYSLQSGFQVDKMYERFSGHATAPTVAGTVATSTGGGTMTTAELAELALDLTKQLREAREHAAQERTEKEHFRELARVAISYAHGLQKQIDHKGMKLDKQQARVVTAAQEPSQAISR